MISLKSNASTTNILVWFEKRRLSVLLSAFGLFPVDIDVQYFDGFKINFYILRFVKKICSNR